VDTFVPGYEASAWNGIGAPKSTPVEIIEMLNREINLELVKPNIKERLAEEGDIAILKFAGIKSE